MTNPADVIAAYDKLIARAIDIVSYVSEPDSARLLIDGDTATLRTARAYDDYGSSCIEYETEAFEADLLTISDEELSATKAFWRSEAERENRERQALAARQREAAEIAQFEALRKKYG